jgi:hypothetical protein
MGLGEAKIINLQENDHIQKLLKSCDPARQLEGEEIFSEFWGGVRDALRGIEKGANSLLPPSHALIL